MNFPADHECPRLAAKAKTKVLRNPLLAACALSAHEIYALARVTDILLDDAFEPWRGEHRRD